MVKVLADVLWPAWRLVPLTKRRRAYRLSGCRGPAWREDGRVVVLLHRRRLLAELASRSNRAEFNHPSWVERLAWGWACVVDLGPALEEIQRERREDDS